MVKLFDVLGAAWNARDKGGKKPVPATTNKNGKVYRLKAMGKSRHELNCKRKIISKNGRMSVIERIEMGIYGLYVSDKP